MISPDGPKPWRFAYSCPSGNWSAAWCAQCTASAVLPTPGAPSTATTASSRELAAWSSRSVSAAS